MIDINKKLREMSERTMADLTFHDKLNIIKRGKDAEELLKSEIFQHFVANHRLDLMDELTKISGMRDEDNQLRIRLSLELNSLNNFVNGIKNTITNGNKLTNNTK